MHNFLLCRLPTQPPHRPRFLFLVVHSFESECSMYTILAQAQKIQAFTASLSGGRPAFEDGDDPRPRCLPTVRQASSVRPGGGRDGRRGTRGHCWSNLGTPLPHPVGVIGKRRARGVGVVRLPLRAPSPSISGRRLPVDARCPVSPNAIRKQRRGKKRNAAWPASLAQTALLASRWRNQDDERGYARSEPPDGRRGVPGGHSLYV